LLTSAALTGIPLARRKSMLYEEGREMARHAEFIKQTEG